MSDTVATVDITAKYAVDTPDPNSFVTADNRHAFSVMLNQQRIAEERLKQINQECNRLEAEFDRQTSTCSHGTARFHEAPLVQMIAPDAVLDVDVLAQCVRCGNWIRACPRCASTQLVEPDVEAEPDRFNQLAEGLGYDFETGKYRPTWRRCNDCGLDMFNTNIMWGFRSDQI